MLAPAAPHSFSSYPRPFQQPSAKPLHNAAATGKKKCVARLLLAKGDLWDAVKYDGHTPAEEARRYGFDDIGDAIDQWGRGDHAGALRALGYDGPLTPQNDDSDARKDEVGEALCAAVNAGELHNVRRLAAEARRLGVINHVPSSQQHSCSPHHMGHVPHMSSAPRSCCTTTEPFGDRDGCHSAALRCLLRPHRGAQRAAS